MALLINIVHVQYYHMDALRSMQWGDVIFMGPGCFGYQNMDPHYAPVSGQCSFN